MNQLELRLQKNFFFNDKWKYFAATPNQLFSATSASSGDDFFLHNIHFYKCLVLHM